MLKAYCRTCKKQFVEAKSRADWKGYCSQKCVHAKSKQLGFTRSCGRTEYQILSACDEIGSVYRSLPTC